MIKNFWIYLACASLITYLIRMLPLVLVKKKIKNKFLLICLSVLNVDRDIISKISFDLSINVFEEYLVILDGILFQEKNFDLNFL